MNSVLTKVCKLAAYLVAAVVYAIVVIRFGITGLLGSHSDLGVLAAPFVGVLGFVGLIWGGNFAIKDLMKKED